MEVGLSRDEIFGSTQTKSFQDGSVVYIGKPAMRVEPFMAYVDLLEDYFKEKKEQAQRNRSTGFKTFGGVS